MNFGLHCCDAQTCGGRKTVFEAIIISVGMKNCDAFCALQHSSVLKVVSDAKCGCERNEGGVGICTDHQSDGKVL